MRISIFKDFCLIIVMGIITYGAVYASVSNLYYPKTHDWPQVISKSEFDGLHTSYGNDPNHHKDDIDSYYAAIVHYEYNSIPYSRLITVGVNTRYFETRLVRVNPENPEECVDHALANEEYASFRYKLTHYPVYACLALCIILIFAKIIGITKKFKKSKFYSESQIGSMNVH